MSNQPGGQAKSKNTTSEPENASDSVAKIAERSQRLVTEFLSKQAVEGADLGSSQHIGNAFMEMTAAMMTNPAKMAEAQISLWNDYMSLWQSTANRMMGVENEPVVEPAKDDRRFRDAAWSENNVFDFIKQSYLLTSNWMQSTVRGVDGLDEKTAKKVDFFTRQFVNALSPSNFAATNPEVLRESMESGGENLVNGLNNLLSDLERGKGKLSISMTDQEAFTIGENVAATPGKVVYRNDLVELLQYLPTTEKVHKTPLLIVTPLVFLGGSFYSIDMLPEFWQTVSLGNPILYMINAFRYGFLGITDIGLAWSYGIILCFIAVLFSLNLMLLNRGYGIRS